MKYKIRFDGGGQEYLVGGITKNLYKHFKENGLSFNDFIDGEMDDELPEKLLGEFDPENKYEYDDVIHVSGPYYDEEVVMYVVDEHEQEVYSSKLGWDDDSLFDYLLTEDVNILDSEHQYVSIGNEFSEGFQAEYELVLTEETFDPSKLIVCYGDYDESVTLVIGVKYNGVDLKNTGELYTVGTGSSWVLRDNKFLEVV